MKDMTGECDVVAWVKVICLVLSALKLICQFVPNSEIMSKSFCNDLQAVLKSCWCVACCGGLVQLDCLEYEE